MSRQKRVIIALSGGADSTAAAMLLKQRGFSVIAVTFKLFNAKPTSDKLITSARKVASALDIEHYVIDLTAQFRRTIVEPFVKEYRQGRTPNPCVLCNPLVKFHHILNFADDNDIEFVATGHYAAIGHNPLSLKKAKEIGKEQSYFLYRLPYESLDRITFPLGDKKFAEVRKIVRDAGIEPGSLLSSQEICFVRDDDYRRFISEFTGEKPVCGNIVDTSGKLLGRHKGIEFYTVGQRRGLGVALGMPAYVVKLDSVSNTVVLGSREETEKREIEAVSLNWLPPSVLTEPFRIKARIRYSHKEADATVTPLGNDRVRVVFDEPQFAPAPGQSVVFYRGEQLIGGGIISYRTGRSK